MEPDRVICIAREITKQHEAILTRKEYLKLLKSLSYNFSVIDIGSNSIKLLVANEERVVHDDVEWVRISTGLGKSEKLTISKDCIDAAVDAVSDLLKEAEQYNPKQVMIVATSAVRDADNKEEFCDSIKQETGYEVTVLNGIEEATYIGKGIRSDDNIKDLENFMLFDLGGGSLEIIVFKDGKIDFVESLQLGGVRLTEQFIEDPHQPIQNEALGKISEKTSNTLNNLELNWNEGLELVGLGGVFRLTRKVLGIEGIKLTVEQIKKLRDSLAEMTLEERLEVKGMTKGRADIMPTALTVILSLMEKFGAEEVLNSSCNLRLGVVNALLEKIGS